MSTRRRTLVAALAAAVSGALLVGCAAGREPPVASPGTTASPGATATPAGPVPSAVLDALEVEIRQNRSDWADRVVQVRVRNTTPEPVVVLGAELVTPQFEGVAAAPDWDRRVPAGRTRDASVPLGAPRCDDATGPPTVRLEVADTSGRTGAVTLEPADPQGHLARIQGEDCARLLVARGLSVTLDQDLPTELRDGELVGTLTLEVTPVAGGPQVAITRVDGTVLLSPVGGTSWPADALGTPVRRAGTLTLDLVPSRCDAHAVAEDKRGTYLGLHTVVDGEEQPVFHLDAGVELRGLLHDFIGAHCGW